MVVHDVTESKANEQAMWDQAFHDTLTGLANRALLVEHLDHAIARAARRPADQFALLFLDLDNFKTINDDVGHILADVVLTEIADRLRSCVRPEDIVARQGGDEFTILLGDIHDEPEAVALAHRIHAALAVPFAAGAGYVIASASIGVALGSATTGASAEDVLRDADVAMYEAKARGSAQTVVFDDGMRARVVSRNILEADVRHAVDREELLLEYQPILALHDMKLIGFEALVRWLHPSRGLLQPADFIPTAEQTGAIIPIDRWVLSEACRQLHEWRAELPQAHGLTMSVNLSAKQFTHQDLRAHILSTLEESVIDGAFLKLEITEATIMERSEKVFSLLAEIRALGVEIFIDDFGTGYSSLSYLSSFPVSAVKVDRSFISRMDEHVDRAQMVRAIVTLAHNLRMTVIAEGIETPEELRELRRLTCECGQGFLFSGPLSASAARDFIERDGNSHQIRSSGRETCYTRPLFPM